MKTKLATLVEQLECLVPGLSPRAIVEQSDHFVFKDKHIITFNEEVMISVPTELKVRGTTPADQFLEQCRKYNRKFETVDIRQIKNELVMRASKDVQSAFALNKQINLPVEEVDTPKKWKPVGKEFAEALRLVVSCAASTVELSFMLVCLHITPEYIEALDGVQSARYTHPVPVDGEMLVRKTAIEGAAGLHIEAICVTKAWFHMKTDSGLMYSCRRYIDKYKNIDAFFATKGKRVLLPDALGMYVDFANTFAKQNPDDYITVELAKNEMTFKTVSQGRGRSMARDRETVKYNGPPLTFSISPALVREIMSRGNKAIITKNRLRVVAGKLQYLTCLGTV